MEKSRKDTSFIPLDNLLQHFLLKKSPARHPVSYRRVSSKILLLDKIAMLPPRTRRITEAVVRWSFTRSSVRRSVKQSHRSLSSNAKTIQSAVNTPFHTQASFPSLVIGKQDITAQGSFAEAQAIYLNPDSDAVDELKDLLERTKTGVVAHYYMDVELQGILQAVKGKLPNHVGIADSLKMGDMAVDMVKLAGCQNIVCLGVDFMSESVQAILSRSGYGDVPVYRAAQAKIGCSLAESAENDTYRAWLQQESKGAPALHVVYINTSLETKAISSSLVPTITCTSSNVLQTILQASSQMGPHLKILYGPDTYMGNNLVTLLTSIVENWEDLQIQGLHSGHTRETLKTLRDNVRVFPSGNCVVHHMFGDAVVDLVRRNYNDCYVTAHLEVPGEMFEIAMQKSMDDEGVVGSTSDILKFISRKVQEASESVSSQKRLRFILGTEAGMVTSIVESVQRILRESKSDVEAEVIFPVAQDAVTATEHESLSIVPGVSGGEGCSTAGGCATCPFMKMNDVDALTDVVTMIGDGSKSETVLRGHLPPARLDGRNINGVPAIDLGVEPILYMREFMNKKTLPSRLCQRVMSGQPIS